MLAHSARGNVGSFSSWECWLIQLVGMRDRRIHRCVARTIALLILDFMKFIVSQEDFPDFLARLHRMNHQGREVTALVQAGLEVFFSSYMGKNDRYWFPINVGWCIKIRDTHVQNAMSLVFPDIQ